mgnify:CR=1 FL=1
MFRFLSIFLFHYITTKRILMISDIHVEFNNTAEYFNYSNDVSVTAFNVEIINF